MEFRRYTHSPAVRTLPSHWINNTQPNIIKDWKPQTPDGPVHDGWAMKRWPFKCRNKNTFFIKGLIYCCAGFWAPFAVVHYQLRKNNSK